MNRLNKRLSSYLLFLLMTVLFIGCGGNDYSPKPRSYFRIALPEKHYRLLDSIYPYTFEYPQYAMIRADENSKKDSYWINIDFPEYRGTLHISYKQVLTDSSLYQCFEDSRNFANKHIAKANSIDPIPISNDANSVYGVIYDISGVGVASTYQFAVTDSVKHFMRGALYFNVAPNNDSLMPVIDYIKKDIDHLIQTLKWKK